METAIRSECSVRFEGFELDLHTGELYRNGLRLKLRGHPIEVLAILLEHPGELVTRETLQKRLWPDNTFVDFEQILNNSIGKLRDTLGDQADAPRFIETLPRLGYRFIAPVEIPKRAKSSRFIGWIEKAAKSARPLGRHWITMAVAAMALAMMVLLIVLNFAALRDRMYRNVVRPRIESIAVLPLVNLSSDPEQEYFADGMTEQLITELGSTGMLRVTSRTSVMRFKGSSKSLPEIGRELGVDSIVEGTIARSGNRIRITANLLDAQSDRHLWANSYESELEDVLVVQDRVAHSIADAIQAELTRLDKAARPAPRRVNPEAYQAYLEGRYNANRLTHDGWKKAEANLRRSIDLDPTFAPAYSAMANLYCTLAVYGIRPATEVFPLAKDAALKAVELDDDLADAHAALGLVRLLYDWDWAGAEREHKRAVLLNPSSAETHAWYSQFLSAMGRHDEALREGREMVRLDPASPGSNLFLAWDFYWARKHDEAISQIGRVLELDPQFPWAYMELGWNFAAERMYPDAIMSCRKALELMPDDQVILGTCGNVYGQAGKRQEALALLARLQKLAERNHVDPWYLACLYDGTGDTDRSIEYLQRAYEERSASLYVLKVALFSEHLRSDPRFQVLLKKLDFPS